MSDAAIAPDNQPASPTPRWLLMPVQVVHIGKMGMRVKRIISNTGPTTPPLATAPANHSASRRGSRATGARVIFR